jgi:hypothetical protein
MERLSAEFLESLLYLNENTYLDFKREQYRFTKASDEEKSELLKDILAFANSWRPSEAYIVIGVKTEDGKQHTVVGCEEHFDDANLQQFVNYKTNRPIVFAYEIYLIKDKKVGIIRIPKQERPIYLKSNFGKLKKEVVYYRLGSATKEAGIDDIYKMGRDDVNIEQSPPIISLELADLENQEKLGKAIKLCVVAFQECKGRLPDARPTPDYHQVGHLRMSLPSIDLINPNYWRELEKYIRLNALLRPISFFIENQGNNLAQNIHIEIIHDTVNTIIIDTKLPYKPSSNRFSMISQSIVPISEQLKEPLIRLEKFNKKWKLIINVGDIKPKSKIWTNPFFIGSIESQVINLGTCIYGDNLLQPQSKLLSIEFIAEKQSSLTIDQLIDIHNKYSA